MEDVTDEFIARIERTGEMLRVRELSEIIEHRGLDGSTERLHGGKRWALINGYHVDATSDPNVFVVFETEQKIVRIDCAGEAGL
ncbi:hypothetical protein [Sphingomonas quercus]|uniref:Uncharacterized protein n=1 Tax=Sphingomonas quercus TaxID=2842451 RepID=A0ABS6BIR8_9SPHN|nr:hypothetical protein [Sphingomonas quercus]MBU3077711.1 hypothetical protein [Sphingomonas quercus]